MDISETLSQFAGIDALKMSIDSMGFDGDLKAFDGDLMGFNGGLWDLLRTFFRIVWRTPFEG